MLRKVGVLFVPSYQNSFYPYLLRKSALAVYILVIIVTNLFLRLLGVPAYAGDVDAAKLVSLANAERVSNGLTELRVDPRLVSAAYAKAENIFELQYWAHFGPNNEAPWDFITAAGYNYVYAGENLAKGFSTSEAVHSAWIASRSHRENILNARYKDIGIAVLAGNLHGEDVILVVQMFGSLSERESLAQLPTTDVDLDVLSGVRITYPRSGDILSDRDFTMRGLSSVKTDVIEVHSGGKQLGESICVEGVWDYRKDGGWDDGDTVVIAKSLILGLSDKVDFVVDTVPPVILDDTLEIIREGGSVPRLRINIDVEGNPTSVQLISGGFLGDFRRDRFLSDRYYVEAVESLLTSGTTSVKIIATDAAGNYSVYEIPQTVLGVQKEYSGSKSSLIDQILIGGISERINRIFVVAIFVLLAIDVWYLMRLNLFSTRGKTILPMAVWLLVVGIGMVIGRGGSIL